MQASQSVAAEVWIRRALLILGALLLGLSAFEPTFQFGQYAVHPDPRLRAIDLAAAAATLISVIARADLPATVLGAASAAFTLEFNVLVWGYMRWQGFTAIPLGSGFLLSAGACIASGTAFAWYHLRGATRAPAPIPARSRSSV